MRVSAGQEGTDEGVDVLIVTAVKEEYDAALLVETGAWPGSAWEKKPGPTGLEVAFRTYRAADGSRMRVALTCAPDMGRVATTNAAVPLVRDYRPRCVAMCGFCAGWRDQVARGDVIIADRLWDYDVGKLKAHVNEQGQRVEELKLDMLTYQLDPVWKQRAESFQVEPGPWLTERPRSYEVQGDWMLERILKGEDVLAHPDRKVKCADHTKVLEQLWKKGWVIDGALSLTEAGRQHIERQRLLHPDGLPEPAPFKVRVGPIGTGSEVVEDPTIFNRLSKWMRKIMGLEMEASAIGAIAALHGVPRMIVMKGVMDHADETKADNFKKFAARASAECLIGFLRQNLSPAGPGFEDMLEHGTAEPPKKRSPAGLLNARYVYVPFFRPGREAMLGELHSFCESPEGLQVQLLYGAGGMGKTRLLIQLCEELRTKGWEAEFLSKKASEARLEALAQARRPVLVVVDYAENHPALVPLLQQVARRSADAWEVPLRIVMLSRSMGDWWSALGRSDGPITNLLQDSVLRQILPLEPVGLARDAVFREAAQRFAEVLCKAVPIVVPSLEDRRFDRVLYVHMAALAAVKGWSTKADELLGETLDHEERAWWSSTEPDSGQRKQRQFTKDGRRAITALTLRGGAATEDAAQSLLDHVLEKRSEDLLMLLHDLYPGAGRPGETPGYIGALEPDLLGEAMVLRTLDVEGESAGTLLDRVFEDAEDAALQAGFTVLGRLSEDHERACGWIKQVLKRDVPGRVEAALEAALTLGERTAYARLGVELARALEREGTGELAERLAKRLPEETVSLREVALWAISTQVHSLPPESSLELLAERASLFRSLWRQQNARGMHDEALTSAREAVKISRSLEDQRPDAFLLHLIASLNALSTSQSKVGRHREALASAREAVQASRFLANQRPDAFLLHLASSLNTLSTSQSKAGRHREALASALELLQSYVILADQRPDTFLPGLARSLHNLGIMQGNVGERYEALASTLAAAQTYRILAEQRPDAFLPILADSLDNLSAIQHAVRQYDDAIASMQEVIILRYKLALAYPAVFFPKLAGSLRNLALFYHRRGNETLAQATLQDLADIQAKLNALPPEQPAPPSSSPPSPS